MLEVNDASKRFGRTVALDGLSLTVPDGVVYGFLGPNGAGKTTTMRAVFGAVRLDSGSIRWNGTPVDFDLSRRFGYLPEERGLYPTMRVHDHLVYLARLHGADRRAASDRATEWLERLGLAARRNDVVHTLSLGNQQRVQLAAALIHDPNFLVLDEPFSGLDPVAVDAVAALLRDCADEGRSVLFSSHQLDLVESLCDAATIVHEGRAVLSGTTDELAATGGRRLSVKISDCRDPNWAAAVPGATAVEGMGDMWRLVIADSVDPAAVLAAATAAGAVSHFAFDRRRLSEVFREAVGAPAEAPSRPVLEVVA